MTRLWRYLSRRRATKLEIMEDSVAHTKAAIRYRLEHEDYTRRIPRPRVKYQLTTIILNGQKYWW
jgi:hypothetical protein